VEGEWQRTRGRLSKGSGKEEAAGLLCGLSCCLLACNLSPDLAKETDGLAQLAKAALELRHRNIRQGLFRSVQGRLRVAIQVLSLVIGLSVGVGWGGKRGEVERKGDWLRERSFALYHSLCLSLCSLSVCVCVFSFSVWSLSLSFSVLSPISALSLSLSLSLSLFSSPLLPHLVSGSVSLPPHTHTHIHTRRHKHIGTDLKGGCLGLCGGRVCCRLSTLFLLVLPRQLPAFEIRRLTLSLVIPTQIQWRVQKG